MVINGKRLTPTQAELVMALLREEAILNRLGESARAKTIMKHIGEEV
jgi:hypothetical protein